MQAKLGLLLVSCTLSACSCEPKLLLNVRDGGGEDSETNGGRFGATGGTHGGSAADGAVGSAGRDASVISIEAGIDAGSDELPAVEIDVSTLIPTSGRQIVMEASDEEDGTRLLGLDVESGQVHELLPDARVFTQISVSPDGRTLLFNAVGGPRIATSSIAHVLDAGFIPAATIEGAGENVITASVAWTYGSRFVVLGTSNSAEALYVIDAHKHTLHWSGKVDADQNGTVAIVAPRGLWFSYALGWSGAGGGARHMGFAHITAGGVDLIEQSDIVFPVRFSDDGTRVAYRTRTADPNAYANYYRDLPGGAAIEIALTGVPDLTLSGIDGFSIDADHVLATLGTAAGIQDSRRLALVDGTSTEIGGSGRLNTRLTPFARGRELVVSFGDGPQLEMTITDLTGTWPDETLETFPPDRAFGVRTGAYGPRHAYYVDSSDEWLGLRLVGRDDGGALQRTKLADVKDQAALCGVGGEHGALTFAGQGNVVLLDLHSALARRAVTLEPQHGGALSCPVWNLDGTAFAIVEVEGVTNDQKRSWVYVASWPNGDAQPSELDTVHEADTALRITLTRP